MGKKIFKEQIKKLSNEVNAIIHFDYFLGDSIAIEKLLSKIVINNKGELLFPESDFGKRSEPRNRLLADLLARTEFMEKAGTGIKRIENSCKLNGNKVSFKFTDAFWITINSNRITTQETTQETTRDKIIRLLQENPHYTREQLAAFTHRSEATVKEHLANLKKEGILKRIGSTKAGYWKVINGENRKGGNDRC